SGAAERAGHAVARRRVPRARAARRLDARPAGVLRRRDATRALPVTARRRGARASYICSTRTPARGSDGPGEGCDDARMRVRRLAEDDWRQLQGIRLRSLTEDHPVLGSVEREQGFRESHWRMRIRGSAWFVATHR